MLRGESYRSIYRAPHIPLRCFLVLIYMIGQGAPYSAALRRSLGSDAIVRDSDRGKNSAGYRGRTKKALYDLALAMAMDLLIGCTPMSYFTELRHISARQMMARSFRSWNRRWREAQRVPMWWKRARKEPA